MRVTKTMLRKYLEWIVAKTGNIPSFAMLCYLRGMLAGLAARDGGL